MSCRALIFDCDGVLVDTERLQAATWREVLRRHGVHLSPEDMTRFIGYSSPSMLATLARERPEWASPDPDAWMDERRELYWKRLETEIREIAGADRFLRHMAPHATLALATSNLQRTYELILRLMGWEDLFAVRVGIEDVAHTKPSPDIYLRTLERLGLQPDECVVFEDSVPGIRSARAARLRVNGVASSFDETTLLAEGAFAAIRDFSDIEGVLSLLRSPQSASRVSP